MKESVDKSALFKSGLQYPGYIFFSKVQNRGWLRTIAAKFFASLSPFKCLSLFFFFLSLVQSKLIDELSPEKERRLSQF